MHYEKASAELITFVNGCFIITGSNTDSTSDSESKDYDSSNEATNGFSRRYFPARKRH